MKPQEDQAKVAVVAPEEPSGLASMLAQYFEQNIDDFPRKSDQARKVRGKLAIEAVEGDVAVTVSFVGDRIEISEGCDAGADMFVRGGIFDINELALGGAGALGKIARGRIKIRSTWRHPVFALRVARFMSLPAELKSGGSASPAMTLGWKIAAAACGAAALGAAAYFLVSG